MFVRKRVREDASDDEEDEDFDVPLGVRMAGLASKPPQRKAAAEPSPPQRKAAAEPSPSTPSPPPPPAPAVELPTACLVLILQAACADGAVPTAARAACVCRAWRDAVRVAGSALWRHADLSRGWCRPSDAIVSRLCRAGTWAQLETLNLAGNSTLSDAALHAVAEHCPALTALDVSGCQAFTTASLLHVLAPPRRVQALSLARTVVRPAGAFEANVRELCGAAPWLQRLSLAGCARVSSTTLRSLLACGELRELDLTGAGSARGVVLPLDALQQACPKLEVLRISGLGLDAGFSTAPGVGVAGGFPRLRVCELSSGTRMTSHGAEPSHSSVDDALLARLLCSSTGLRELAAAGTHVTADGLAALPECALELLMLDQSDAADDAAAQVAASQWHASLQVISLAGGGGAVTDDAAAALAVCTALRRVDLSGSAVTVDGVRELLRRRRHLAVELAGCRSLPRPIRQAALAGGAALRRALGL